MIGGFLEVGTNEHNEIVINHPDLKPDENGVGHIIFSATQARDLATLLLRKAEEVQPELTDKYPNHFVNLSAETCSDVLLLASVDVPIVDVESWTMTQRVAAASWAYAVHLSASDNILNQFCRAHDEDVEYDPPFRCICVPPKPEFLKIFPAPKPFPMLQRVP